MANEIEIKIPDIGGAEQVDVIDILVKVGERVEIDSPLVTLEGDKATMDIPSPQAGIVKKIIIQLGDKVAQGSTVLMLESESSEEAKPSEQASETKVEDLKSIPIKEEPIIAEQPKAPPMIKDLPLSTETETPSSLLSAGPAVRRLAREFGIDLTQIQGSGRKTRITKEDVQSYVKARLSEKPSTSGFSLPVSPVIDFSKFGEIESKPLNKIKKLTGINVHRSWVTIPHVTQFDEADITDLEAFRKAESENAQKAGYKLTLLAFVSKVVSKALKVYPQFNSSLDSTGEQLIYKKYCNIGIAVETPNGLVVPVIKNADKLTVSEIALEMARLSKLAREKGLTPMDMSGACFTISSLGGIGGTAFTPIVNSPEVAILGLSKSSIKPVYLNNEFQPRLMLPLSLSYDHRVVDGAEAARFTKYLADSLADIRKILL